jgi:hypothetical protein
MIVFNPEIRSLADMKILSSQIFQFRSQTGYTGWPLFRGQADYNWPIIPSIVRSGLSPDELKMLEPTMISVFTNRLKAKGLSLHWREPYSKATYHESWLAIQQAQHFRLPTRLIDWTLKENVALAFAVVESAYDHLDGVLFLYFAESGEPLKDEEPRNYLDEDPYSIVQNNEYLVISPSTHLDDQINDVIAEKRMRKQGGKFILQDYPDCINDLSKHPVFSQRLYKFNIPKEYKTFIREELKERAGVNDESLYHVENDEINQIVKELRDEYGF